LRAAGSLEDEVDAAATTIGAGGHCPRKHLLKGQLGLRGRLRFRRVLFELLIAPWVAAVADELWLRLAVASRNLKLFEHLTKDAVCHLHADRSVQAERLVPWAVGDAQLE
jgi:hypothetical protein